MLTNLNIEELIIIAALLYAAYRAFKIKEMVAAVILAVATLFMLNFAGASTDTFEGPDTPSFGISEVSGLELIIVGGIIYAAFRLFKAGENTAAITAGAAGLYSGFLAGTGSGTNF